MSEKSVSNCLKFSLLASFMLFVQTGFSQATNAAFDQLFDSQKKLLGDAVSITIADADTVYYQKAAGDIQPKSPLPIGASSQWLTTALVMQLVDEGKLSLDDRIDKYLPVFASYFKGYITVRHCLTHQTGIGTDPLFKLASFFEKSKFNTLEEAMLSIAKKEIHANTGEQFRYTHYGMFIVARIAEIVSKKQFAQIIRTKLFVPLGMRNTTFTTEDGSAPNPAVGARSTSADYTRFLQMLLKGGKANNKQILSEAAVEEMRKVQIEESKIKAVPPVAQGFGFALGSWAVEGSQTPGEKAPVLALPSLDGTWPVVDFTRGYTIVVLAKDFKGEQKADVFLALKNNVDANFPVKKN